MLKFVLITFITLYLLYKASKYMMRWAFLFAGKKMQEKFEEAQKKQETQQRGHFQGETYRSGNVEVEVPMQQKPKRGSFKGGEYVDYEEVE